MTVERKKMRADAAEDSAVPEGRIAVTLTCARGLPEQPEVSESGECPLFTSWRAHGDLHDAAL